MKEEEMRTIARLIARVIREKQAAVESVAKVVTALTERFPLYAADVTE